MNSFMTAVQGGDLEEVEKLLAEGCSANFVDEETGNSALAIGAWNGNVRLVELLLASGADPNMQQLGDWPIILAASQGHTEIVAALLAAGALASVQNGEGSTALMYASSGGHRHIVEMLLASGADPRLRDHEDTSAILCAARKGHRNIIELLVPFASASERRELELNADIAQPKGASDTERQFFQAVKSGEVNSVKAYLQAGGDANVTDRHGIRAVRYAMTNNHMNMLETLVEGGANLNLLDDDREYPLYYAAKGGSEQFYQFLLPHTAEALRDAPARLRKEIIEKEQWKWDRPDIDECYNRQGLTKEDINRIFRKVEGSTSQEDEAALMLTLDQHPELATVIKPDGTTLLMAAAACMNLTLVKYLVEERHLDPNATNVNGHCALRFARHRPDRQNPQRKRQVYDYLYGLTEPELRYRVEQTMARESASQSEN